MRRPRGSILFVWGVWAAATAGALAFVAGYGRNMPRWDDFSLVPQLTRQEPVTLSWLWAQFNEHRVPLLKLGMLTAVEAGGWDFRAVILLSVAGLAAAAAGLIVAATRLRGGPHWADAFFPLLLLHGGHCETFLWPSVFHSTLTTVLALTLLLVLVRQGREPTGATVAGVGLCLGLLALCGGHGLVFLPPLLLWLGSVGVARWRAGARRDAVFALAAPALIIGILTLYFVGYRKVTAQPANPGLWPSLRTAAQFLSMSFGHTAWSLWPLSALVAVGVPWLSGVLLLGVWLRRPEERPRVAGLLLFLGGVVGLALGVAWGRAGFGYLAGLQMRYVTLTALAWCVAYFVWELYGPAALRGAGRAAFLLAGGFFFAANVPGGLRSGEEFHAKLQRFERDVEQGVPPYLLARRYTPFLHSSHDPLAAALVALHKAGFGPLRGLRPDPPFLAIPLPVQPVEVHEMEWADTSGTATGHAPHLVFALPEPTYVTGLRLTYRHTNPAGTHPNFWLFWKGREEDDFGAKQPYEDRYLPTGPAEHPVTIWICDRVAQFRLHPDDTPCEFTLSRIEVLVPLPVPMFVPIP